MAGFTNYRLVWNNVLLMLEILHDPHMGGCQDDGPFLGPYDNTAPSN